MRVTKEFYSSCLLQESSELDPCGTISSFPSAYELWSCCFYFSVAKMCPRFQVFAFSLLCLILCQFYLFLTPLLQVGTLVPYPKPTQYLGKPSLLYTCIPVTVTHIYFSFWFTVKLSWYHLYTMFSLHFGFGKKLCSDL